jgi:H+/Cl- antiporter ClcA
MSYGTSFVSSYLPGIERNLNWNIVILLIIIIIIITTIITFTLASFNTEVWWRNSPTNSSSSVASTREHLNCFQWLGKGNVCRLIAACPCCFFYFASLTLTLWRWRRCVPTKSPAFSKLHGVNIQETVPFIFTAVKTSNSILPRFGEGLFMTYKTDFGLDVSIYCTLYIHNSWLQTILRYR